jgi:hypothetical protein
VRLAALALAIALAAGCAGTPTGILFVATPEQVGI